MEPKAIIDDSGTYELSHLSTNNEDQGALLGDDRNMLDDFTLSYRREELPKRRLRLFLYCTFLLGLILTVLFVLISILAYHRYASEQLNSNQNNVRIEVIWTSGFPKLITETAFRLVDCNADGILDVIFGFGTGVDTLTTDRILCDLYFDGVYPCNGGVKALDGRNGQVLWSFDKSRHEVFALNCQRDIDGDHIPDCLTGGRGGTFEAISGRTGRLIWTFDNAVRNSIMNFYTPLYVNIDFDNDGLDDIVTIHGGDPTRHPHDTVRLPGEVLLVSTGTGRLLNVSIVPDRMESYYSPQLLQRSANERFILVGTGGETHGGALYAFDLRCFSSQCSSPYTKIIGDDYKGVMTPPVLIDVNGDKIEDIIIPLYNSSLFAFDGRTFKQLWNRTFPSSETYSSPAVGYFNDDDTPDIMIHYQTGPGYPLYYSAQTTILDGLTGVPLLNKSIQQTVGAQSSPLTVSFKQRGHDMFIYWMGDCDLTKSGTQRKITYDPSLPSALLSHADICKLRYQTTSFTALYGLTQQMTPPGLVIYDSNQYIALERSTSQSNSGDIDKFLQRFPNYAPIYQAWLRLEAHIQGKDLVETTTESTLINDEEISSNNIDDEEVIGFQDRRKKFKRHVGPHDDGGLQRTISTGTLAPSFELNSKASIDLVFATYWIQSDTSALLHADEQACIDKGMANEEQRLKSTNDIFSGMDHDAYEHYIEAMCTNETRLRDTVLKISPELIENIGVSMSNPFKKQMGQLTVYRVRLHFTRGDRNCDTKNTTTCRPMRDDDNLAPFEQQIWPAYMGINGDCHANNRH